MVDASIIFDCVFVILLVRAGRNNNRLNILCGNLFYRWIDFYDRFVICYKEIQKIKNALA